MRRKHNTNKWKQEGSDANSEMQRTESGENKLKLEKIETEVQGERERQQCGRIQTGQNSMYVQHLTFFYFLHLILYSANVL